MIQYFTYCVLMDFDTSRRVVMIQYFTYCVLMDFDTSRRVVDDAVFYLLCIDGF